VPAVNAKRKGEIYGIEESEAKKNKRANRFAGNESSSRGTKEGSVRSIYGPAGIDEDSDDDEGKRHGRATKGRKDKHAGSKTGSKKAEGPKAVSIPISDWAVDGEFDVTKMIVQGTSTSLEKDYLRLTSAPDPATVRPEPILVRAVAQLREKWAARSVEYLYMCSQLKAVRQDLTVQHIQNGKIH
jgi:hypothetical protein